MSGFDEALNEMAPRAVLGWLQVAISKALGEIDHWRRFEVACQKVLDEETMLKVKAEMDYPTSEPDLHQD